MGRVITLIVLTQAFTGEYLWEHPTKNQTFVLASHKSLRESAT